MEVQNYLKQEIHRKEDLHRAELAHQQEKFVFPYEGNPSYIVYSPSDCNH